MPNYPICSKLDELNTLFYSANHLTAAQCRNHADTGEELQVIFTPNIRMKNNCDVCV